MRFRLASSSFVCSLQLRSPKTEEAQRSRPLRKRSRVSSIAALAQRSWATHADVEGVPGDPNVVYVASASGGLWKTTNGGVKWTPIFERQGTSRSATSHSPKQPRCCVGRNGRVERS